MKTKRIPPGFGPLFLLLIVPFLLSHSTLQAQEKVDPYQWPKELETKNKSEITLYQPQLESMNGNILEGRMAITIKPADKDLIFGAVWFKATMSSDKEQRMVTLEKMDITDSHFPDIMDQEKVQQFSNMLAQEMESWNLDMSYDRLVASLEEVENLKELSDQIKNDPPVILLRKEPSVLVLIDGEPIWKKEENSGLEYVVNTAFFIVKDPKKKDHYIRGGDHWYASSDLLTGWEKVDKVPSKIEKFAADNKVDEQKQDPAPETADGEAPKLVVSTRSAELVVIDGDPDYKPVEGTNLLYVANTESDIIMDINSQQHYILLGGRWFYAKSLDDKGTWSFEEPDELPEGFDKIPEESDIASVRSSVPGTDEAKTALLEQSIPQTATIDKKTATLEVQYDGKPQFEKIGNTDMSYAKNTDKSVLLIDGTYYCVDDAVWFFSSSPNGPWKVSDERPEGIDDIPPESPVYNVKYTYVYDSTPDVVYVGYLPGYTYSYVYSGVVVYGTGYYYRPWYGYHYYPRPVTYGFGVHWNPYTGWGFSFGISWGWMSWSFHPYGYGYWGARGYRHGYRHGYYHGYHAGRREGYARGYAAGRYDGANRNVYNRRDNGVVRTSDRTRNVNSRARTSNKANNIYTDRNGNVYQRDQKGNFERRSNTQRPSTQPQQRPSTQPQQRPSTRPSTQPQKPEARPQQRPSTQPQQRPSTRPSSPSTSQQNLNRSYQSRSRGAQNYQRSNTARMGAGGGRRR